eukprot:scaffold24019_cov64-Isochrysis_galbana.AAC.1
MIILGLGRSGDARGEAMGAALAAAWLKSNYAGWRQTGGMHEKGEQGAAPGYAPPYFPSPRRIMPVGTSVPHTYPGSSTPLPTGWLRLDQRCRAVAAVRIRGGGNRGVRGGRVCNGGASSQGEGVSGCRDGRFDEWRLAHQRKGGGGGGAEMVISRYCYGTSLHDGWIVL